MFLKKNRPDSRWHLEIRGTSLLKKEEHLTAAPQGDIPIVLFLTTYKKFYTRYLAVVTVCCEPVSTLISLLSWENTGNISILQHILSTLTPETKKAPYLHVTNSAPSKLLAGNYQGITHSSRENE